MKSIPVYKTSVMHGTDGGMPELPSICVPASSDYSAYNRRITHACGTQRAYPWLLFFSTAVAGLFCVLYITKPVIVPAPAMIAPVAPLDTGGEAVQAPATTQAGLPASLLPARDNLPGEAESKPIPTDPRQVASAGVSNFEETNLRIQHVLTAEAPGGQLDRIILDVPVLYQSRNLRWTSEEVAAGRELLVRLMEYQEKCRDMRSEGVSLLDAWNRLVERSIPGSQVRADSPSLPDNQQDSADSPRPTTFQSADAIQIQTSGK